MYVGKVCAALVSASLCMHVHAQVNSLTLEQAVQLARARAPQLQAQNFALEAAQSQSIASGRLPDPELIAGVQNVPVNTQDAWSLTDDFMTMRTIGIMQSFPNGAKRRAQRELASANTSLVSAQARVTELEVARETATAWIEVYTAELLHERLLELQPAAELGVKAANAALASGRGSTVDAFAAQSQLLASRDELLKSERDVRAARSMLARWIGDEGQSVALSGPPDFSRLSMDRAQLLNSLHQHATIAVYQARLNVTQSELEGAKAERKPDWSAELAFSKRGEPYSDMVSLEFRVGLPVFNKTRRDPLISAKHAEMNKIASEREDELRMHAQEVAEALATWESIRDRLELYRSERLPNARQQTQAALAAYQSSATPLSTLLTSITSELQLQRDYSLLLGEMARAWSFLEYLQEKRAQS